MNKMQIPYITYKNKFYKKIKLYSNSTMRIEKASEMEVDGDERKGLKEVEGEKDSAEHGKIGGKKEKDSAEDNQMEVDEVQEEHDSQMEWETADMVRMRLELVKEKLEDLMKWNEELEEKRARRKREEEEDDRI